MEAVKKQDRRSAPLGSRAYEYLKDRIMGGEFPSGTVITQRDIAIQMGVSRTPVRDALMRLEKEGLLKSLHNGLLVVTDVPVEDMKRTYEVRALLEGYAAKLAAQNKNQKTISLLKSIVDEQKALINMSVDHQEIGKDFINLDARFHLAIVMDSGNPRLIEVLDYLMTLSECQRLRSWSSEVPERLAKSVSEHERILEAIATGDEEAANKTMFLNLEGFCVDIISSLLKTGHA